MSKNTKNKQKLTQKHAENDILYHRFLYHVMGKPEVLDSEYDKLEQKYMFLFPKSKVINSISSNHYDDYPKNVRTKAEKSIYDKEYNLLLNDITGLITKYKTR